MNNLQGLADYAIRAWFSVPDPARWPYTWLVYLGFILLAGLIAVGFAAGFAGPMSFIERRIAGRMMSRIGPNRVGPQGIFQFIADGIKSLLKEDIVPAEADRPLFLLAPYLVFTGMFGTFVALPFAAHVIAADLDVGILWLLAIPSLVVVGLLMAGWGSNSKWAVFGGVRSAAQLVSYEIPSAFALLSVVLFAGTLSTQGIIAAQGPWPWEWFIFRNPLLFVTFFIFFISALAEGNRAPFDLPEAESELVSGYNVEYSGMRFVFFFFAEWANLWVMSALATTAFLGGWQVPGMPAVEIAAMTGWRFVGWEALSFLIFALKTSVLVFVVVQLRWTLPRLRVDQLMTTCWKYLVPLSLITLTGNLVLLALVPERGVVDWMMRGLMVLIAAALALRYLQRVRANYLADRENYRKMEGKELWYPPYRLP
ncbi:NADH-quinone oxidoreductase subunit NuoH [Myxococcota bacterium]|nr:NADH-quinone oxidoreductase subunit NuoH [Myxococcota bacterium]MBU1430723.1 NADH-quinone oxidoreductase subunit NuoH [Myxococcota bacterium]MBU1898103.1 NADH-quinone oxidoreductase subunit NuoH [Myxococcota bacterium]